MSVSKWAYELEKCEGKPCGGDCDICDLRYLTVRDAEVETECVEVCPHCGVELHYINYNAKENGYKAYCMNCGKQIFLCDECLHEDDNPHAKCDWREEVVNGERHGLCWRGRTVNREDEKDDEA